MEGLETNLSSVTYKIIDLDLYQKARAEGKDPLSDPEYSSKVKSIEVEGFDAESMQSELMTKAGAKPFKILRHLAS